MLRRETVGTLLITYKDGSDKQEIRWVKLSDFQTLQSYLKSVASLTEHAAEVGARIAHFRALGMSDAALLGYGIDVAIYEKIANSRPEWTVTSYQVDTFRTGKHLRFRRNHLLQPHSIRHVELTERFNAWSS